MPDTTWTHWTTFVEWTAEVAPAVQARLMAFLDVVLNQLAALAARCDGGDSVEVIIALGDYVQQLDPASGVNERVAVVWEQAMAVANEEQVHTWTAIISEVLETDAQPIQWATSALLLERILRAALASGAGWGDPEGQITAADSLEAGVRHLLVDVVRERIPANAYQRM